MSLPSVQEKGSNQYQFLNEEDIIHYVKKHGFFREDEPVSVIEISDGKINHVYRLTGEGKTLIYKQAVPYARTVGETMPLPLDRVRVEARVLQEYDRILPGSAPKVLLLDENMAILITEDMSPMQVGRTALIHGAEPAGFTKDVAEFSAQTLFYTSDYYLDPMVKKELNASLMNPGMRQLTEELVFDRPFQFHESNYFEAGLKNDVLFLSQDQKLKKEVAKLKHKFMTKADALIHSDLHSGAIFVSEDKTVVFDTEFACFGPFGFDMAHFIANLFINGIGSPQYEYKRYEQARETWYAFSAKFSELWRNESNEAYTQIDGYLTDLLEEIFSDMLGYAGCEMIRRAIGIAQIDDLNHEQDEQKRMERRRKTVELGKYLIMERSKIRSLEELENWFR
ncbi:S-methyl-5-thioribose kinase [Niallia endozanthoxylica]|uniref:S-methyl-5-thioribose kinase n=1 Tax=Niallia endozanthoxylica TaxID=2036016 RepID=A0A5J5I1U2_9BACI|nr:S-methyl-5-thioribose kinase [Niallia endozanthoxylica]KAA9028565.1 S-methyl-5-thioribose kinase [Niallia endozanthoxylica]